jgi:hypothetical protein
MATQSVNWNAKNSTLHVSTQGPTSSNGSWGRTSYDYTQTGAVTKQHVTGYSPANGKTIVNIPTTNRNMGEVVRSMYGFKS